MQDKILQKTKRLDNSTHGVYNKGNHISHLGGKSNENKGFKNFGDVDEKIGNTIEDVGNTIEEVANTTIDYLEDGAKKALDWVTFWN